MTDEVNWDNVQWSEPVKYNPAEGIPTVKPPSCPKAQLLEWLLAFQNGKVLTLDRGTSVWRVVHVGRQERQPGREEAKE
jgi:hypothetical protein